MASTRIPRSKRGNFPPRKHANILRKPDSTKSGADGILVNEQGERLSFTGNNRIQASHRRSHDPSKEKPEKPVWNFRSRLSIPLLPGRKYKEKKHEICLTALNRSVELYPRYWGFLAQLQCLQRGWKRESPRQTNSHRYPSLPRVGQADRSIREVNRPCRDQGHCLRARTKNSRRCRLHSRVGSPVFSMRLLALGAMAGGIQFPSPLVSDDELYVHWIDPDIEAETKAAIKEGEDFGETTLTFDQHQQKP